MSTFKLPDLGEGVQEAELVSWAVSVGDRVVTDQPLVSVETDKAVVEIPAPFAGEITALHGEEGDIVKVGAPLVEISTGAREDKGAVVGDLPGAKDEKKKKKKKKNAKKEKSAAPAARAKAAPAVRRLASQLGVSLDGLEGEGPDGVITAAQVRALAGEGGPAPVPLRGPRRAMAAAMARARDAVCPATITDDADISAWAEGVEPTPRLIRAIAAGAAASPNVNARFDAEGETLHPSADVDVGVAVDAEGALYTPVLRKAQSLSAKEIEAAVHDLARRARDREVSPEEMRGASITLSNFGPLGGRYGALVVTPPQVAILGAGVIADRPVARDGAVALGRVLPLSLTFDHRALTGGEAARFLASVKTDLEKTD